MCCIFISGFLPAQGPQIAVIAGWRRTLQPVVGKGVCPVAENACSRSLEGLNVLVIDDDEDSRVLMETMLRYCGAFVIAVKSAKLAHRALAHVRPDVIVSDLAMPEEDGFSFIRELRADPNHAAIHALAVTAYAHHYSVQQLRDAGFTGVLRKPLSPDAFARAVAALGPAPGRQSRIGHAAEPPAAG